METELSDFEKEVIGVCRDYLGENRGEEYELEMNILYLTQTDECRIQIYELIPNKGVNAGERKRDLGELIINSASILKINNRDDKDFTQKIINKIYPLEK